MVRHSVLKGNVGGFRENYGDYFGITVAGYPEAHPEVITDDAEEMERAYQSDLQYLKQKVRDWLDILMQAIRSLSAA